MYYIVTELGQANGMKIAHIINWYKPTNTPQMHARAYMYLQLVQFPDHHEREKIR